MVRQTFRLSEHPAGLLFGAVNSVVSVVSFAVILWRLSGTLHIIGIAIPKALFWAVLVHVLVSTVVAFWIGRPLVRLSFRNELFNAAFRYALVRLRDAAEAVGFYRGEQAERAELMDRFDATIANYRRYVRRTIGFLGWNVAVAQPINPLPFIVQAPRLFAGSIKLGDLMQSASAFGHIEITVVLPQLLRPIRQLPGRDNAPQRTGRGQRRRARTAGVVDHGQP